jgi:hypothetical protein
MGIYIHVHDDDYEMYNLLYVRMCMYASVEMNAMFAILSTK